MASAFPHHPPVEHAPQKRTSVVVDREDPTDVLPVLSSETAQQILGVLGEEPGTASDVADALGKSLQNVTYHLDRLCETDVVTPVDTWYSEKGKEMTVYALAAERLVIEFGGCDDVERGSQAGREVVSGPDG
ncbi:helix-turn-helix domain-containing protein [Halorubrum sp. CBA1125]|jgi:DNA-binding transcriptional ArsR family regulator|uniref:ArsR/SmtB family transcription factor n=1 Tax=Halorubrum sp. CBA1125 TaxID=2668072 RepID=UPI0012E728E6|nr:winged helix-turn-helix domain-containing protein [Halorubrum sp. CBA1125]MUW15004.1 helix-turn-helix domain-containing protein [Halorubrum sp. CBA1125]